MTLRIPKGVKAIYAEPFAAYIGENKSAFARKIWDGEKYEVVGEATRR